MLCYCVTKKRMFFFLLQIIISFFKKLNFLGLSLQFTHLYNTLNSRLPLKRNRTSLIIKEMQIKTTMRYHLTFIKMVFIKQEHQTNQKTTSVGAVMEKLSSFYTVGKNVKWRPRRRCT